MAVFKVNTVSVLETRKLQVREDKALFLTDSLVSDTGLWQSPEISSEGHDSSSCVSRGLYPCGGRDPELLKGVS